MSEAVRITKMNRRLLREEIRRLVVYAINTEYSRRQDKFRVLKNAAYEAIAAHARSHIPKFKETAGKQVSFYPESSRPAHCTVTSTVTVPTPKKLLTKYLAIKKQYDTVTSPNVGPSQLRIELLVSELALQIEQTKAPFANMEGLITKAVQKLFK